MLWCGTQLKLSENVNLDATLIWWNNQSLTVLGGIGILLLHKFLPGLYITA